MSMRDQLIKPRVERMRRASRGAAVMLLSQSDGYECYLEQAVKVHDIIGDLGIFKNIQVDPDSWDEEACEVLIILNKHMFEATNKLRAAGITVALLDADSSMHGAVASYVCIALLQRVSHSGVVITTPAKVASPEGSTGSSLW